MLSVGYLSRKSFILEFKIEKYLNNYTVNYILRIGRNKTRQKRQKNNNLLDKVVHAPENVLKYQNNNPLLTFFLRDPKTPYYRVSL